MYADQLLDVLKHSCPRKVAGFFAETIQVCTVMCLGASDSHVIFVLATGCWWSSTIA